MKLAVISHTRHYLDDTGRLKGWGPTVRELNYLSQYFEEIVHVACLHREPPPASALEYSGTNIRFVEIPPSGGKGLAAKISVISESYKVIRAVRKILSEVDAVQLRVPTGMANYLLPYLTFLRGKPLLWIKYAGNWGQENAPAGYRFQRWWLKSNFLNAKVTINGKWNNQPSHCLTFENPCLEKEEREHGMNVIQTKDYSGPYSAVFVGRVETPKGVARILESLPVWYEKGVRDIHFIGDGPERKDLQSLDDGGSGVNCTFHGSMSREEVAEYLVKAHFILLPSTASEGFPKAVAEGANYGAIPVVSDISSISQYVNDSNGFVWNSKTSFIDWVNNLDLNPQSLKKKSLAAYNMAEAFTFEKYYSKLKHLVFT